MTPDFRDYQGQRYLAHYGVLGMKWGVRRYQNEDGTLTTAGLQRYAEVATKRGLRKHDTRVAKSVIKTNRKPYVKTEKKLGKKLARMEKRYGEGDFRTEALAEAKERVSSIVEDFDNRLAGIKDGTYLAGRDFIVLNHLDALTIQNRGTNRYVRTESIIESDASKRSDERDVLNRRAKESLLNIVAKPTRTVGTITALTKDLHKGRAWNT